MNFFNLVLLLYIGLSASTHSARDRIDDLPGALDESTNCISLTNSGEPTYESPSTTPTSNSPVFPNRLNRLQKSSSVGPEIIDTILIFSLFLVVIVWILWFVNRDTARTSISSC